MGAPAPEPPSNNIFWKDKAHVHPRRGSRSTLCACVGTLTATALGSLEGQLSSLSGAGARWAPAPWAAPLRALSSGPTSGGRTTEGHPEPPLTHSPLQALTHLPTAPGPVFSPPLLSPCLCLRVCPPLPHGHRRNHCLLHRRPELQGLTLHSEAHAWFSLDSACRRPCAQGQGGRRRWRKTTPCGAAAAAWPREQVQGQHRGTSAAARSEQEHRSAHGLRPQRTWFVLRLHEGVAWCACVRLFSVREKRNHS